MGVVRPGKGRGRELGFPTANLEVDPAGFDLRTGVYVGRVQWDDEPTHGTVVNYGVRPTFAESEISLEVYVLGFSGNLYGKTLTLEFRGLAKGFVKVHLELDGLKTTVDVRDGGLFFQAGRVYKGGILVLAIGAKTGTSSATEGVDTTRSGP